MPLSGPHLRLCAMTGWHRASFGSNCEQVRPSLRGTRVARPLASTLTSPTPPPTSPVQECPACQHGTCSSGVGGTGLCVCEDGWAGDLCDTCAGSYYGGSCQFQVRARQSAALRARPACCVTSHSCCCCCWYHCQCADCGVHASCSDGFTGTGCVCDASWRIPNGSTTCTECITKHHGSSCDPYATPPPALCRPPGQRPCCLSRLAPNVGAPCVMAQVPQLWQPWHLQRRCQRQRYECVGHALSPDESSSPASSLFRLETGRCVCDPGWYGTLCTEKCPACDHGTCDDGRTGSGTVRCVGCSCASPVSPVCLVCGIWHATVRL